MQKNDLISLSIMEAQKLIRSKTISPVDLTKAYLDNIDTKEEKMNAYIEVYKNDALNVANGLEKMQMAGDFLGPLHGIPIALKDNIFVENQRVTAGSKIYFDNFAKKDAPVVSKIKSAGAVILGKTLMHEFAWGATTDTVAFGASHNPWDYKRFCCGSSGGSACAVSGGTAMAALGTDTGGSVRLPSSVCGLVGMRPTIGRVSIEGIVPLAYSMDACGPITKNICDNAIMLQSMSGYVASDCTSVNRTVEDLKLISKQGVKGMKIGILPSVLFQSDQLAVVKAVKNAIKAFEKLGAEIVECNIEHLDLMQKAWYAVCSMEASSFHQKNIREHPENYGEDVRTLLLAGELTSGVAYIQAQKYRRWLRREFEKLFETVDFFLFPTLPATAVPIGEYDLEINGKMENMLPLTCTYVCYAPITGLPALTLPCGQDQDGMPIGMQLIGKAFSEKTLYQAGYVFEKVFSLKDKLPLY